MHKSLWILAALGLLSYAFGCGGDKPQPDDPVDLGDDDDATADDDDTTPDDDDVTADDDDDTTMTEITISDMAVDCDQPNPLACVVTWTTDVPSTSSLEWGDSFQFESLYSDELVTEHEAVLIGLHSAETTLLHAVSEAEFALAISDDADAVAGYVAAPGDIDFEFNQDVYQPGEVEPGWVITTIATSATGSGPILVYVFDEEGEVVFFWTGQGQAGHSVEATFTHDGYILVGGEIAQGEHFVKLDWAGRTVWESPDPQPFQFYGEGYTHHVYHETAAGTIVRHVFGADMQDIVQEMDYDGNLLWDWDSDDVRDPSGEPLTQSGHPVNLGFESGNSSFIDYNDDALYYSDRGEGMVKVDRATNGIQWQFTMSPYFLLPYLWPVDNDIWTYGSINDAYYFFPLTGFHGSEVSGNDQILMFDNNMGSSRVVQYGFDEANLEVWINWQWPDMDTWRNWCPDNPDADICFRGDVWGDADALPGGNVLATTGRSTGPSGNHYVTEPGHGRIVELRPDGNGSAEVVWELRLTGNSNYGSYAVDKIGIPPRSTKD